MNHTFCVFVRIASANTQNVCFPEEYHENNNEKKIHDPLIFDQIDVITNFAVITNVVIKRVHCIKM